MHCGRSAEAGFTRMELGVVMAAVGLWAGLALPLMGGGAVSSRTAVCLDNLQQLNRATSLYALEYGTYPPNADDNVAGYTWVTGQAGPGGGQEFNADPFRDPNRFVLGPYVTDPATVLRCPADARTGRYQGTNPVYRSTTVPASRSVAMNAAVGVNPYARVSGQPVDGRWLDNNYGHTYGRRWRTYGKPEDAIAPSPAGLLLFIDEDERSINDGLLATGMQQPEWIDWPGTRHDTGATVGFADGHGQLRRWVDGRTVVTSSVSRRTVPRSVDIQWVQERTSAELPR